MAIPFYEPDGPVDQIDGHQMPPSSQSSLSSTSTSSSSLSSSPSPSPSPLPAPPLGQHFYTPPQTFLEISGEITEIPLMPDTQPSAEATATATAPPVDIDEALAWKLLAITICKTLKLYPTTVTANTAPPPFPATNGVLQIWPNGHVHANWTPK